MAKRGQGEGSISKRPDGTWWARITVGKDNTGKQKRKAFYGRTRKEVQEKLTAALNDMNNNAYIELTKMTVTQWMETWLREYKKYKVRASTYLCRYDSFKDHIEPKLGGYKLKALKKDTVQRFINSLSTDEKLSYNTVGIILSTLHGALEQAFENELIAKNPSSGIKMPVKEYKEKRVLSLDEQNEFIKNAWNSEYGRMFILMLGTGIRIGEAIALTWDDLDLDHETLKISKTVTKIKDPDRKDSPWFGVGETKTKAGNRNIPLLPELIKLLKTTKNGKEDHGFIFRNQAGGMIRAQTAASHFRKIIRQIGIDEAMSLHGLRHTFATRGLEKGIDLKIMQEILGHSSIKMTADLYTHVLPETKKNSMLMLVDTIKFDKNIDTMIW